MRRSQRTTAAIVLATSALLLSGCSTSRDKVMLPPLAVHGALGVVEVGPVHLTVERLYPVGAKVQQGGIATLIGTGNPPDLATNAETQVLRAPVERADLRIILTVAEGMYRIVGRRSAGISTVADLRGKRIATSIQSSSGYFLHLMLARGGMTFADVTVVDVMPYKAMVDALKNGEVDAISIWEPHSENAMRALGSDAVELPGQGVYRELFNLNTTAATLSDPAKRAQIVQFVRELIDTTDAMNRDPRRAQELVAAAGGYSLEEVAASWRHHAFTANFPDDMLDVMVDEEIWLAALQQRAPRSRDELARLIDRTVYDEARARPR
ncbi:ABC transporter substrate-binding protein [Phenylobacterium sp.]|uniref:ABC transporter substrate-binding protein n=1 Tax=Phenylobacterium sp. TaxID=1871053 RepID=UPI002FE3A384